MERTSHPLPPNHPQHPLRSPSSSSHPRVLHDHGLIRGEMRVPRGGGGGSLRRTQPLNHPRQVGWQEEPHGAQQADDDEHPEEDAVDHHGHVLPVLLHLPGRKGAVSAGVGAGRGCSPPPGNPKSAQLQSPGDHASPRRWLWVFSWFWGPQHSREAVGDPKMSPQGGMQQHHHWVGGGSPSPPQP